MTAVVNLAERRRRNNPLTDVEIARALGDLLLSPEPPHPHDLAHDVAASLGVDAARVVDAAVALAGACLRAQERHMPGWWASEPIDQKGAS